MRVPTTVYDHSFYVAVVLFLCYTASQCLVAIGLVALCYIGVWIYRRNKRTSLDVSSQCILITGCDTGFGLHSVERLHDVGFTVFAGVLDTDSDGARTLRRRKSKRLHVIKIDVTSDDNVTEALQYIRNQHMGLWGVVSNAGMNFPGDIELTTTDQFQRVAEVNLYGGIRVIKACLPLIRESKGRVLTVSSARGLYSWPGEAAYNITKHGIEAMADSLRLEMRKFGVKVVVIQPGDFDGATSIMSSKQLGRIRKEMDVMWEQATGEVKATYSSAYLDHTYRARAKKMETISPVSSDPVLDAIEDALVSSTPSNRYLIGGTSGFVDIIKVFASLYNILPECLTDIVAEQWTGCLLFPSAKTQS